MIQDAHKTYLRDHYSVVESISKFRGDSKFSTWDVSRSLIRQLPFLFYGKSKKESSTLNDDSILF